MKTLYLIDGTALLYRAYYAHIKNPLTNSKGMNTSAIFGVVNSFMHFVETMRPEHVIIAFDRKGPTFRHEMSEAYKANRPPMPDDMQPQVAPVMKFFELITIPELGREGWEADDVLGTLAVHFKKNYQVVMVTGDKDYSQLVDERVQIYDPMKDQILDTAAIIEKYGIEPSQFIDYLALMGDSSDNIPGVKGIGPKGAQKLLQEFGTLDSIYENLEKIPEKIRQKLIEDRANAYLSRELATIALDAPIEMPDPDKITFRPELLARAKAFLGEYEINYLKKRLETMFPEPNVMTEEEELSQGDIFDLKQEEQAALEPAANTEPGFVAILTGQDRLDELYRELAEADFVSIDCETDSTDPMQANLVGISLCYSQDKAWYLPLAHQMADNLPIADVLKQLQSILAGKLLIGHNLKYDLIVFERAGLQLNNPIFDTMLASYILDPGKNRNGLDAVMLEELSYRMQPISELIGKGKSEISFDLVDPAAAAFYAAEDAWAVFRLYPVYAKRLDQTGLLELYQKIELPVLRVLKDMEETGVYVDSRVMGEIGTKINRELKRLTDEIYEFAGYQFNLNSPQQLGKFLFEDQKIPTKKKTKTGYSTDSSVLEELADDYEIAAKIMQYRQLTKLDGTYVSALPKLIHPETGRIHSSFNQTVASTGRLSSTNPNLQNIPIRTELGREIRKAFVAQDKGKLILSADYSQIELRLLALISRDQALLEGFANDIDIHRQTAARITGKALEDVTSEERRRAKVINFGLLYGMGQKKLSRELGISTAEAKAMIEEYFAQFPFIRSFINDSVMNARRMQYCETIFGRRLYLPMINNANQGLKAEAERVAVNMPIQGSAADLIKLAMIDIHEQIQGDKRISMILQVHDELVFEVDRAYAEEAGVLIGTAMENALPQEYRSLIRLKADIGMGENWYEAH